MPLQYVAEPPLMRMKWLLLFLFSGVGVVLFSYGAVLLFERYDLLNTGEYAEGMVVDNYHSRSTYRDERTNENIVETYYFAVVEFQTDSGETVRFRGATGSRTPEYENGTVVQVLYDTAQPSEAQIVTFSEFWLWPLVATGLGLFFLLGGIGGYHLADYMDREQALAFERRLGRPDCCDDPQASSRIYRGRQ